MVWEASLDRAREQIRRLMVHLTGFMYTMRGIGFSDTEKTVWDGKVETVVKLPERTVEEANEKIKRLYATMKAIMKLREGDTSGKVEEERRKVTKEAGEELPEEILRELTPAQIALLFPESSHQIRV